MLVDAVCFVNSFFEIHCIERGLTNKGRFCNTIALSDLVHTSMHSDQQMQTKDILSTNNSKQT